MFDIHVGFPPGLPCPNLDNESIGRMALRLELSLALSMGSIAGTGITSLSLRLTPILLQLK
jgi:hypothetical protein